jgi:hypothetical protein
MLLCAMVLLAALARHTDVTSSSYMSPSSITIMWCLVVGTSVCHQHALALTAVPLTVHLSMLPSIQRCLNPTIATYALLALLCGFLPHMVYILMAVAGTFPGSSAWTHVLARGFTPLFHTQETSQPSQGT